MDWETIVNDILSEARERERTPEKITTPDDDVTPLDEVRAYMLFIAKHKGGKEVAHEIEERFDRVLAMYSRLAAHADEHNISWTDETKFDVDLYAAMIFTAYYLQKAWSTVDSTPPPVPIARVIGYALMVGYRLGILAGSPEDL